MVETDIPLHFMIIKKKTNVLQIRHHAFKVDDE